ncbi:MAG: hypothetical protein NUW37_16045 [Planctomycetes bacterium]|nr:hypothetical protein [Planctomycetota bacterium]
MTPPAEEKDEALDKTLPSARNPESEGEGDPPTDVYLELNRAELDEYGLKETKDLYHPKTRKQRLLDHLFLRLGCVFYALGALLAFWKAESLAFTPYECLLIGWGTFFGLTFFASMIYFALIDTKERGG